MIGVIFVSALTDDERAGLQSELDNLTEQVNNAGYNWLINYSVNYSEVDALTDVGAGEVSMVSGVAEGVVGVSGLGGGVGVAGGGVEFDYIVDPTTLITEASVFTDAYLVNTTAEANFTHLTIDDTQAPYDSLVLYMPFDVQENVAVNKTYDYSKNNNDGTLVNGTAFNTTGCAYGNCYGFDGVGDFVNVANNNNLNVSQITISAWINTKSIPTGETRIVSKNNAYEFYLSVQQLKVTINNATSSYNINTANQISSVNTWYHVVFTYNGSTAVFYKNGTSVTSFGSMNGNIVGSSNNLFIGCKTTNSYFFNGSIDEVMIFNTSLTSAQISAIYNNQSQRFKTQGTQTIKQVNITSGYNWVNLTTDGYNRFFGSNISVRLGMWDVSLGYNNSDMNATANGLVGYWHLDEASWSGTNGEVIDAMGLNNGTAQNATGYANTTASGYYNRAGSFNGISNFVNATNSSAVISHCLWQKNSTATSWIFVAYNGSTFFTNAISGLTAQYPINISGSQIKIGFNYTGSQLFNGSIDEVMIFNRSLSADEIKELYVKGRALWNYTAYQNLSEYNSATPSSANVFNISLSTTNLLPDFLFLEGNQSANAFYSPNLRSSLGLNLTTSVDINNFNVCANLTSANSVYKLTANIVNNGLTTDCISVTAQNITLDCQGFSISSTQNYTGVYSNQWNTTVKNCNISMGSDGNANAIGIELTDAADYSTILNNTIIGEMDYGISFAPGNNGPENSLIENNTVNVSSVYANGTGIATTGIYLRGASNNILRGNNASTLAEYGIYLQSSSNNNLTSNTGSSNSSRGILLDSSSNNTLTSNTGSSNSNYGIYLYLSSNNNLTSNTGSSNSSYGIYLSSSSNNTLTSNTGTSNSSVGIYLNTASNNTLTSNIGTSNTDNGIYLSGSSNNNIFVNNTATTNATIVTNSALRLGVGNPSNNIFINNTAISGTSYAIYLSSANNNIFINQNATGYLTNSYGIAFNNANNTIIQDCINISGVKGDVLYVTSASSNNTFINCSYRTTGTNETVMAGGSLTRKWYYRAYVNDTTGAGVSNANVSAFNSSSSLEFTELTNNSGWTNITTITEYVNNGGTRGYYGNYTINSSAIGFAVQSKSYNVSSSLNNLADNFQMGGISGCMNLTTAGATYTLTGNVVDNTITGDCIQVQAQNITLNCAGFSISSTQNYTGVYSAQWNTTVKNCNISMGTDGNTNAIGIELTDAADYSTILNNTIIGEMDYGISFAPGNNGPENSLIENNTVDVSAVNSTGGGIATTGIYLRASSNNILRRNNASTLAEAGIYLRSSSNNNLTSNTGSSNSSQGIILQESSINNILISNTGSSNSNYGILLTNNVLNNILINNIGKSNSSAGIYFWSSSNNNLTSNTGSSNSNVGIGFSTNSNNNILINNTATSNSSSAFFIYSGCLNNIIMGQNATGYLTGSYAIDVQSGSNNTIIQDCVYVSGVTNDTRITGNSINNTFINCSYNISKENVVSGSSLIRKWYYRAYVNDTTGAGVGSANVSAYNSSSSLEFTELTNSSGWTNITTITEYVNLGGTRSYYNNYTINSSASGFAVTSHSYNVTAVDTTNGINNNLADNFQMGGISGCMNLTTAGATYTLTGNIINDTLVGDCIIVKAQNITLNCAGYSISSTQNYTGVYSAQWNTTIKNCNISMGQGNNTESIGIELTDAADYSSVVNNTIWDNGVNGMFYGISTAAENQNISYNSVNVTCGSCTGIYLNTANNNTLVWNNGSGVNSHGIYVNGANNNTFTNNTGTSNSYYGIRINGGSNNNLTSNTGTSGSSSGIYISYSTNNVLISNRGSTNSSGAQAGIYIMGANNNLTNNIGTGNASYGIYIHSLAPNTTLIGNNGTVISAGSYAYGISIASSGNNIINNTGVSVNQAGISISGGNNTLTSNTGSSNSSYGIYLLTSSNNTLTSNTGSSNSSHGIYLYSSSNNTLTSNTGTSNSNVGIYLDSASNNNTLTSNTGISNSSYGIQLNAAQNNTLTGNTGTSNSSAGIYLGSAATNNILTGNNATSYNYIGLYLSSAPNNIIKNQIGVSNTAGTFSWGIYNDISNNTIIQDCINFSGITGDVRIKGNSLNVTFINCTYRITGTNETIDAGSSLIRKWYYRAYVNDTTGAGVSGANVTAYNSSSSLEFTEITNSSGFTNITTITEYVNTGGTRQYYGNYTINSSATGFAVTSHSYNVTAVDTTNGINNNLADNFQMGGISGCMNLTTAGATYTLTGNINDNTITGDCIIVKAQNITLNCAGFSISSTQNYTGVYSNQWNTTIKNCNISMGSDGNSNAIGIELTDAADYSTILNNTIIGEMDYGISFAPGNNGPENSLIENNTVDVSAVNSTGEGIATTGIYLRSALNNTLRGNNASTLAEYGIYIYSSSNNTLTSNTGTSNSSQGIRLESSSNNNILISNTGTSNSSIGILLTGASNNTLINNSATSINSSGGTKSGLQLSGTSQNNIFISNIINSSYYGIYVTGTSTGNNFTNNLVYSLYSGIYLSTNNNYLYGNNFFSPSSSGIYLSSSSNNTLTSNTGSSNSSYGIVLYSSSNNNLTSNTGSSNSSVGIYLSLSSNNALTSNTATSNSSYAVYVLHSNYNIISNQNATGYSTNSYGIVLRNASYNNITDCVYVSGVTNDVYLYNSSANPSVGNIFLNCSYNLSKESVLAGNSLTRKWYYRAYVNDTTGAGVSNANVSAYNSSSSLEFAELTNSSGWTNITTITEYVNTGGTRQYYGNYTINASASGFAATSHSYNVTAVDTTNGINNNLADNFQMGGVSGCMNLTTAGATYTLTGNIIDNTITGDCISVTAQNITLNCAGFSISSTQNYTGVYSNQWNTTVKNCNISMGNSNDTNAIGIEMTNAADYSSVVNNTISGNMMRGIDFAQNNNGPENSLIENNTVDVSGTVNAIGIYLRSASNNVLNRNNASALTNIGIYLNSASNNNLTNNVGTSNSSVGIYLVTSSNNNILTGNTGTSNSNVGIYLNSASNNNLTSNTGTSNSSSGIYLNSASNNSLIGNNGTSYGISGLIAGIILDSSSNNNLTNNYGYVSGGSYAGIEISNSNNNILFGNNGTSLSAYGIHVISSNYNTLTSNIATSNSSYALYMQVAPSSTIIRQTAIGLSTGSYGLHFRGGGNNTIQDCINISGVNGDVSSDTLVTSNNTFINCSYNLSKESLGASSQLIRKWYYRAYVNDTTGSGVSNANVSAYNSSSSLEFTELTNSSGWTNITQITEYVNTGGTRGYYGNYTINATHNTSSVNYTLSHSYNVSASLNNLADVFSFDTAYPLVSFTSPTPANDTETTNTSIEINISIVEHNLDEVKYNWNGTNFSLYDSSLVLQMNFDNNSALGECYDNETEILTLEEVECSYVNENDEEIVIEYYDENGKLIGNPMQNRKGKLIVENASGVESFDSLDLESLFVNPVMVIKIFKDYYIILKPKNENKTSDLDSLEITQIMPEIFKMLDSNFIASDNLFNLLIESNGKISVFSFELANNSFQVSRNFKLESHFKFIKLSNSSTEVAECEPFSKLLSFSTYSSFNSSSSTGYQSILSHNSWSSIDKVPVLSNLSNMSCLINFITALTNNSESKVNLVELNNVSSMKSDNNGDYLSFLVVSFRENISNVTHTSNQLSNEYNSLVQNARQNKESNLGKEGKTGTIKTIDESLNTKASKTTDTTTYNLDIIDNKDIAEQSSGNYENIINVMQVEEEGARVSDERNLSLISFVVMTEENENDSFVWLVNPEFKNLVFHNMNSSFTSEIIPKGLVVMRVKNDFIDFFVKNFSQEGVLFADFINSSLAGRHEVRSIAHFIASKNSSTELYLMGVSSFNILFNSSICSFLGGNSSTGCQSISSQNSQSSSVTSPVSWYLLNMSCFRSLTINLDKNLGSSLDSLSEKELSSCILTPKDVKNLDYLSFAVDSELIDNKEENHSYLTLISGLDSNAVKNSVISSFVPVQVPTETLPVSVSRIVMAATLKTPLSSSIDPIFIVKRYFTMNDYGNLDYLNISVLNKCYKQKWKYFYELNGSEKVATFNSTSGEVEWENPLAYQEFDNSKINNEMYKIQLVDSSGLLVDELMVSEKHRVYASEKEEKEDLLNVNFSNEFGADAQTNGGIMHFFVISNESGISEFCTCYENTVKSTDMNFSCYFNCFVEKRGIIYNISMFSDIVGSLNSSLVFSCESCCNSSNFNKSNRWNSQFYFFVRDLVHKRRSNLVNPDLFFKNDILFFSPWFNESFSNNTGVKDIVHKLYSLSRICLINSVGSSSEISSLRNNSLSSSKDSSSCSFCCFSELSSSINKCNSLSTFNNLLINVSSMNNLNNNDYKKLSVERFNLRGMKDVYSSLQEGKEIYFLNSNNEPVKVESIEKVAYSGKIYDVDVENDIVLVRRKVVGSESLVVSSTTDDRLQMTDYSGVWSGNSNSNNFTADVSKYGNNGNCSGMGAGCNWNSSGRYGGGMQFDGVNDYVNVSNNSILGATNVVSVSAWIKKGVNGVVLPIVMKDDPVNNRPNYGLDITSGNMLRFFGYNGTTAVGDTTGISFTTLNQWTHVVGTFDGTYWIIYINGNLTRNISSVATLTTTTATLKIGYRSNNNNYFNGSIDEVRIYNRSLSASEVYQLYVSNLQKYNSTQWYLYVNQSKNATSGLSTGAYTYFASAKDTTGNENLSETRRLSVLGSVNNCVNLTSAGTTYLLTGNIINNTITGDCIIVKAQNITLNCAGYSISSTQNYTGVYSNQWNTTVKNCNVSMGQGNNAESIGIEMTDAADYSSVVNNTIVGNMMRGIDFSSGSQNGPDYSLIESNTIDLLSISGSLGIYLLNAGNNNLKNNNASSSNQGIFVQSSNNNLTNNRGISNLSSGIYIRGSSNNLTSNTGTSNSSYGIWLEIATNNILENNLFISNSSIGIYLDPSSDNNILTNNTGTSNTGTNNYGIYIRSDNNTLTSNTGTSNSSYGIYLSGSSNNTLTSNTGSSNSSEGIYLYSSSNNNLTSNIGTSNSTIDTGAILISTNSNNNILTGNNGTCSACKGIYLYSSSNNTLTSNTGSSTSSYGIYLNSASNNNLTSNTGSSNSSIGIYLSSSSNNTLISNTGSSNSSVGIYLSSSSDNTLTSNIGTGIASSTWDGGIVLSGSSNNILTNNLGNCTAASGTTQSGISLLSSSNNNTLINNTGLGYVTARGILLSSSSNNTLTNNTGSSNSLYGIYLYLSSNNNLTGNNGTSNSSQGIRLESSSNNNLNSNTGSSNSSYAVYLYSSNNNILANQTAIGYLSGSRGIAFRDANNTIIQDCVNVTGFSGDVLYVSATSSNNTFINCSYRTTGTNETVMAGGNLIRKWYYRAYVNDTTGTGVSNANVSAYNSSSSLEFTELTNSSGWTNITTITEYVNTGGTRGYYGNYSVNATASGYTTLAKSENITILTNQLADVFSLSENVAPVIYLIRPLNHTGDRDGNISFIYNVSDANVVNNCSLIINNAVNMTNNSITANVNMSFRVTGLNAGRYNWSVNCTDSFGNIGESESRMFAVVLSSKFTGNTTDLSSLNISNVTNLVLEKPSIGLINFTESVDLSNGSDIDADVNISFNRVEINSSRARHLNKRARLSLHNLSFSNPRVLKDGAVCSDCTEVGYSGGIFVFDVTGFSVYSSEETPVSSDTSATTSSSGSGGGIISKVKSEAEESENFNIDIESLNLRIVKSDVKTREIKIKNLENKSINLAIELENLEKNIAVEKSLNLEGFEEKIIQLKIIAPDEPGVHTGKIILSSKTLKKEILVSLNIQSKETLFDLSMAVPDDKVSKNEKLKAQLNLLPIGEKGVDVSIRYVIKDFKGKSYYEESETFYVDKQISFEKELELDKLGFGDYVLGAEMTYAGGFATASSQFEVIGESVFEGEGRSKYFVLIILGIILLIAFLIIISRIIKYKSLKRKIEGKK